MKSTFPVDEGGLSPLEGSARTYLQPGREIERYRVEALISVGGMGAVYRVRHLQLGTEFALKVLRSTSPDLARRLLAEGRIQAGLRHPNIVAVTDVLEVDGAVALVMEYLPPPTLEGWLRIRPRPEDWERLFRGTVEGVQWAHQHGVIHRDLKPSNILLSVAGGVRTAKVADFGIAKILGQVSPHETCPGVVMGTPGYMAPEQRIDSANVCERADIWALGAILYEMFAEAGDPPPDTTRGGWHPLPAHTPERVRRVAEACLRTDKTERPEDCAALLRLLDERRPLALSPRLPTVDPTGMRLHGILAEHDAATDTARADARPVLGSIKAAIQAVEAHGRGARVALASAGAGVGIGVLAWLGYDAPVLGAGVGSALVAGWWLFGAIRVEGRLKRAVSDARALRGDLGALARHTLAALAQLEGQEQAMDAGFLRAIQVAAVRVTSEVDGGAIGHPATTLADAERRAGAAGVRNRWLGAGVSVFAILPFLGLVQPRPPEPASTPAVSFVSGAWAGELDGVSVRGRLGAVDGAISGTLAVDGVKEICRVSGRVSATGAVRLGLRGCVLEGVFDGRARADGRRLSGGLRQEGADGTSVAWATFRAE